MEIEIDGKIIHFKDTCNMAEYINAFKKGNVQMVLLQQVQLIADMSREPTKLTRKELLKMDANKVLKLLGAVNKAYSMPHEYDFLEPK